MIRSIQSQAVILKNNVVRKNKTLGTSTRTKDGKYLVIINEETGEQAEVTSEEEATAIKYFYLYS